MNNSVEPQHCSTQHSALQALLIWIRTCASVHALVNVSVHLRVRAEACPKARHTSMLSYPKQAACCCQAMKRVRDVSRMIAPARGYTGGPWTQSRPPRPGQSAARP